MNGATKRKERMRNKQLIFDFQGDDAPHRGRQQWAAVRFEAPVSARYELGAMHLSPLHIKYSMLRVDLDARREVKQRVL